MFTNSTYMGLFVILTYLTMHKFDKELGMDDKEIDKEIDIISHIPYGQCLKTLNNR